MSQRVLITAAASGIGLEIARAFSAAGANVFITDINAQALTLRKKRFQAFQLRYATIPSAPTSKRWFPQRLGHLADWMFS